jgi:TPR repeat protein
MGRDFPRAIRRQRIANPLHGFHTQTMPRTTATTGFFLAIVAALMLFATTPVAAGAWEDGAAAYNAGDYQKAYRLWKPLAEQGDMLAQGKLGYMYSSGKGVPKNDFKSVQWYTKAAKQGAVGAQLLLAGWYLTGDGVPENIAKAFHWYTKAAKQGDRNAQYQLGYI